MERSATESGDQELQVARLKTHMGIVVETEREGWVGCDSGDGWLEVSGDGAEVCAHVC